MTHYGTGEVEELLGLPASTLRFWEKEVPFLAPRKDVFGRRIYSPLDLCVLSRLKFLAFDRGLGLKAACEAMELELTVADPALKADVIELKTSLYSLKSEALRARQQIFSGEEKSEILPKGTGHNGFIDQKSR